MPSINRMGEPCPRRNLIASSAAAMLGRQRDQQRAADCLNPTSSSRRDRTRRSDLLAVLARVAASPSHNARRRMLVRPLGYIGRRLHHALHERLLRSKLKPLFVTLGRRIERAHRENELDHRQPVFKQTHAVLDPRTVAF
jgi:hypothetical protein